VDDEFDDIQRHPELHAVIFRSVRQALVKRFPYVVCYTIEPTEIAVISVFHCKRDPKVWKSRAR
jgi:hypothetical protein